MLIWITIFLFTAILKDADLEKTSSKKVRMQLESKLGVDLNARKKEIDNLVMDYVNSQHKDSEEESESESEPEEKQTRRSTSSKKPAKKAKAGSSDDNNSESAASEEEYRPQKTASKGKKGRKRDSSDEANSDGDWKKPKKARKSGGAKGKSTGFTRPYTLSPDLASIMGTDSCPRHEVVKKVWSIIKERNLYDPKNKQYAICDDELLKVIGVKRFRTFGMLKYLKQHFID